MVITGDLFKLVHLRAHFSNISLSLISVSYVCNISLKQLDKSKLISDRFSLAFLGLEFTNLSKLNVFKPPFIFEKIRKEILPGWNIPKIVDISGLPFM